MKSQLDVNTANGSSWYRCKSVEFADETALWELSPTGRYDFWEAYKSTPHRQLIKASDDVTLKEFVRAWGPLRNSLDTWNGADPLKNYREARHHLTLITQLLASVREPEMMRSALIECMNRTALGLFEGFEWKADDSPNSDDFCERLLENAKPRELQNVATSFISTLATRIPGTKFEAVPNGESFVLRQRFNLMTLEKALHWMVFQDAFLGHPIQFCFECRSLIDFKGLHKKRFCSHECAHRSAARESAKRKRKRGRSK